jgi:hypothetical protein
MTLWLIRIIWVEQARTVPATTYNVGRTRLLDTCDADATKNLRGERDGQDRGRSNRGGRSMTSLNICRIDFSAINGSLTPKERYRH